MLRNSLLLMTDGYKLSHHRMYPPGMDSMYSYMEARAGATYPKTIFFGMRYIVEEYLTRPFGMKDLDDATEFSRQYFGRDDIIPYDGMKYILEEHGGIFPIRIMAIPEGTMVERGNILCTVESTDKRVPWVTNFVESVLLKVWYPSTVATLSWSIKQILAKYLMNTVGSLDGIEYMLHDFGYRGASSEESSALAGAAHLLNFVGTDTIQGDLLLQQYYDSGSAIARSVPAAEHSTINAWGRDGETKAFKHIIDTFPDGIVAVVSDSYDIYNACKNIWGVELRDQVLARDGRLVIRPDSGSPVEAVVIRVLDILRSKFGMEKNARGYLELPGSVRVLQGDGVNAASIERILFNMELQGYAASNILFGMGGALVQSVTRDTQDFSMKCSHITINGEGRDVYKLPSGQISKASKSGRMKLIHDGGCFFTVPVNDDRQDELLLLYQNGVLYNRDNYNEIKARCLAKLDTERIL